MNDPLRVCGRWFITRVQIEDDMLPILRTVQMRLCSRAAAMSDADDFSGSFFQPSHTELDNVASDALRQASRNGFHLR